MSHGIILSKCSLERILNRRRKNKINIADETFIQRQVEISGQCHGYRWMHQKCWLNGNVTDRKTVRILLQLLNGDLRSRNSMRRRVYHCCGPNSVWHIDGYDNLKSFGLQSMDALIGFPKI